MVRGRRISYSDVKKYFENNGCILLSDVYKNINTKLDYIGICGHKDSITFNSFRSRKKFLCNKCCKDKLNDNTRLTYEYVNSMFKKEGCKLITDNYKSNRQKLKYIAKCGHEHFITFSHFTDIKNYLCSSCNDKKKYDDKVFTYNYVKSIFIRDNCKLLTDNYINSKQKLEYIAKCGDRAHITFNKFNSGQGRYCRECTYKNNGKYLRLKESDVKDRFNQRGCKLLSEYTRSCSIVKYIAKCGHEEECLVKDFFRGHGTYCKKCIKINFSRVSIEWLEKVMKETGIYIQHAMNEGEYKIPETSFRVDGYCKENNTVFEFYGDFWHGNPDIHDKKDINRLNKKTFGELYNDTLNREQILIENGYNVITIWEKDYRNDKILQDEDVELINF